MSNEYDGKLDTICEQLGIPKLVFEGINDELSFSRTRYLEQLEWAEVRLKPLRESFTERFVQPFMEQLFPGLYWKLLFLGPSGRRVMVRRDPSEYPKITYEE